MVDRKLHEAFIHFILSTIVWGIVRESAWPRLPRIVSKGSVAQRPLSKANTLHLRVWIAIISLNNNNNNNNNIYLYAAFQQQKHLTKYFI